MGFSLMNSFVGSPRGIFNSIQGSQQRRKIDKVTSANYSKFVQLLTSPDVPFEIKLNIWQLAVLKIDDLHQILKLLGCDPHLDQIVRDCLQSKHVLLDWLRRAPNGGPHDSFWKLEFYRDDKPKDAIELVHLTKQKYKKLAHMVVANSIFFKTVTLGNLVCSNTFIPGEEFYDHDTKTIIQTCGEIRFDVPHVYFLSMHGLHFKFDWLSKVRKMELKYFDPAVIRKLYNLKDLTVSSKELMEEYTVRAISGLNDVYCELNSLTIEYEKIDWIMDSVASDFGSELMKFSSEHPSTTVKFKLSKSFTRFGEFTKPIELNKSFLAQFKHVLPFFENLPLILSSTNCSELNCFSNLNTLMITGCVGALDNPTIFQSVSVKKLLLEKLQPEDTLFNFDFSGLTGLQYLKVGDGIKVDANSFKTLPSSVKTLLFQDCNVSGIITASWKNLESLTISGSPKLKFWSFFSANSEPTANIKFTEYYKKKNTDGYVDIVSDLIDTTNTVYYEKRDKRGIAPKMYAFIIPFTKAMEAETDADFVEFLVKYAESDGTLYYEKIARIQIFQTVGWPYRNIFKTVINACIQPYDFYDTKSVANFRSTKHPKIAKQIRKNLEESEVCHSFILEEVDGGHPNAVGSSI